MKLNHLDLHVPDVGATSRFFVDYLGFQRRQATAIRDLEILEDANGLELVISRPVEAFGGIDQDYVGAVTYHLGFLQERESDVDALYDRLLISPAEIRHPPRAMRGGRLFYLMAPGRILIEIAWRP